MYGINLKHSLATVAVAVGVLAAAGPASAAYQHNQTDLEFRAVGVTDGTSNTMMLGERAAAGNIAADGRDLIILIADNGGQF